VDVADVVGVDERRVPAERAEHVDENVIGLQTLWRNGRFRCVLITASQHFVLTLFKDRQAVLTEPCAGLDAAASRAQALFRTVVQGSMAW
jgi:hypothetical protein